MNEAVGSAFVFKWIIIFLFLIMFLLFGSLLYTRTFKIRNEVITIIEQQKGWSATAQSNIDAFLGNVGYRRKQNYRHNVCPTYEGWDRMDTNSSPYFYCIYSKDDSNYYRVTIYMYLDLPIVGDFIQFPVSGDTRNFRNWADWQ